MENREFDKFEKAQRRILKIKKFYNHVFVFVLINGVLLLLKDKMAIALLGEEAFSSSKAMSWVNWNLYIWLAILAVHALLTFGKAPSFIKKWEERQIEKFIEEDND